MQYPFKTYRLGTRFGTKGSLWKCGYHSGLDLLSAGYGGDGLVRPLYVGTVTKIGRSGSYGNCVYIKHPDGYLTLYAHLKTVYVQQGMQVKEDTVLGVEGATGNATGRHLHLEVHKGDYHYPSGIDPLAFIQQRLGGDEMEKKITIRLNGVEKQVTAIEKDGHNYVMLQDLRDGRISVDFDASVKVPVIEVMR